MSYIIQTSISYTKGLKNNSKVKLEDLKVLRRSPDLLNNVKIGQGQLQLIREQILFDHVWPMGVAAILVKRPKQSPYLRKRCLDRCVAVQ